MYLSKKSAPYVFISPFFLLFALFFLFPIFYGVWLSLNNVFLLNKLDFAGIRNYMNLFANPRFYGSLKVSVLFTLFHGSTHFLLALVAAVILNSRLRGRVFFRAAFFLPVTTSLVVAALIWVLILDKDIGLLNVALRAIGFSGRQDWLNSTKLTLWSIVFVADWRWFGYQMVILLAGLQNIPVELSEAAKIDGANGFQIFFFITVPLLYPVIFFCIVVIIIGSLNLFAEPFVLTEGTGGPADSTLSLALYLYKSAFEYFKIGYAAALGYVLSVLIIVLSYVQVRLSGSRAGL